MRNVILTGILLTAMATASWADALLFVSPLRVEMKPEESTAVITVTNKSSDTKRYSVELADQIMTNEGVTEGVETFPYSSKRMLRFMPRRVVLEPGQRQVIRIMARRPEGLPDGDYHTHMMFEEEQPAATAAVSATTSPTETGLKLNMNAIYSVAIPVVVQNGAISSSIALTDIQLARGPDGKPEQLLVGFHRGGNAEATATLHVTSKGSELISPRRIRMYHEVDDMVIAIPLSEAGKTFKGTAEVKLLGDDSKAPPLTTQSFTF